MMSIRRLKCSWSWGRYSWSKPRSKPGFTFCTSNRPDRDSLLAVFLADVALDDRLEFLGDALALERHGLLAVDVHRRHRHFAAARQADADMGVLRLAGAVDHAAHHRDAHLLHAGVLALPHGHLRPQKRLDALGKILEHGAGRTSTARAGADHRRERAQAH